MSVFTPAELDYLTAERRLARIATVGPDGTPHVVPSGCVYNPDTDTIDLGGIDLTRTKKARDVQRRGRAAVVVDDVLPPWRPRGIEVRGEAEVVADPDPVIRLRPRRIVSWGLDGERSGARSSRSVP